MNKKQKEILIKKFKEQQKLNLMLFKKEINYLGEIMDYKEEKMSLDLSIYNSKRNLKEMEICKKEMKKLQVKTLSENKELNLKEVK